MERGIAKVRDVLGTEQRKAENVDGPDGLFAIFKERLTGMRVVAKTGSMNDTFDAWDALPLLMRDDLWNDTNFTNALGHTCVLLAAASNSEKVSAWLNDGEFVEGIKVVLRDMYEKRRKLQRGEAYQGLCMSGTDEQELARYRMGFCRRSLVIINKLISVFEFIIRVSEGGTRNYSPEPEAQPNGADAQPLLLSETSSPAISAPAEAGADVLMVDATTALAKLRTFIATAGIGDVLILDPRINSRRRSRPYSTIELL